MASVTVDMTVEVEMRYLLEDEPCENTLYFHKDTSWAFPDLAALGLAMKNWWITYLQPYQSVHAQLREIYLTDLTTNDASTHTEATGLPLSGAVPGESMPNNIAPCISFRTLKRGRSFRGRNYLMGLMLDAVSENEITDLWAGHMVDAYTALFSVGDDLGCTWCVVSRYSGYTIVSGKKKPTPRAAGLWTPVSAVLFVDKTVDSQRGRLPNH